MRQWDIIYLGTNAYLGTRVALQSEMGFGRSQDFSRCIHSCPSWIFCVSNATAKLFVCFMNLSVKTEVIYI